MAGIFTVMLPISATVVAVLVLGEALSGIRLLALSIALISVALATLPSGKAEVRTAHPPA
jgi:drug/metabolite transporter (DMT)-like permease